MKSRTPTKDEKTHMQNVRELGCIACIVADYAEPYSTPAEYVAVHHIDGKTKAGAHMLTIGLCPEHHQHGSHRIHGQRKLFIEKFGTEEELLELAVNMYANDQD